MQHRLVTLSIFFIQSLAVCLLVFIAMAGILYWLFGWIWPYVAFILGILGASGMAKVKLDSLELELEKLELEEFANASREVSNLMRK